MAKINLVLSYDTETQLVSIDAGRCTIGLGQMMCHEALAQLDEKRRLAFMQQLQEQAQEALIRATIAGETKTREV